MRFAFGACCSMHRMWHGNDAVRMAQVLARTLPEMPDGPLACDSEWFSTALSDLEKLVVPSARHQSAVTFDEDVLRLVARSACVCCICATHNIFCTVTLRQIFQRYWAIHWLEEASIRMRRSAIDMVHYGGVCPPPSNGEDILSKDASSFRALLHGCRASLAKAISSLVDLASR